VFALVPSLPVARRRCASRDGAYRNRLCAERAAREERHPIDMWPVVAMCIATSRRGPGCRPRKIYVSRDAAILRCAAGVSRMATCETPADARQRRRPALSEAISSRTREGRRAPAGELPRRPVRPVPALPGSAGSTGSVGACVGAVQGRQNCVDPFANPFRGAASQTNYAVKWRSECPYLRLACNAELKETARMAACASPKLVHPKMIDVSGAEA
jgi:hypothetical protein